MSTTTEARSSFSPRVVLQKVGTSLSNMVMPNIPALIAWGILTAFFIKDGFTPVAGLGGWEDAAGASQTVRYALPDHRCADSPTCQRR